MKLVEVVFQCIVPCRCCVAMHWALWMLCCRVLNLVDVVLPCIALGRDCVAMH